MCGPGSVLGMRILMRKAPEFGSSTDPDPRHCLPQLPEWLSGQLGTIFLVLVAAMLYGYTTWVLVGC